MFEFFKRTAKKETETPVSNIATLVREGDNLLSDSLILLDERLSGNLFCADEIVVEQNGVLSGNMTAKRCVVSGTIKGDIVSTDQMDVKSTAVIYGNIKCAAINIEPGAVINGKVIIAEDNRAAADLMDRINNHSADEYQNAKLAAEQPEPGISNDNDNTQFAPLATMESPKIISVNHLQDKPVTIRHEEPREVHPFVQPQPVVHQEPVNNTIEEPSLAPVNQKPLVAPAPRAEEKPADDDAIQRWW